MLRREPEGIIAGLIVRGLARAAADPRYAPDRSQRLQITKAKKSRGFAANAALCFLKLGEKTSLLKRIPLYHANVFLPSSSNPAKLVMLAATRLRKRLLLPGVAAPLRLGVFVSF